MIKDGWPYFCIKCDKITNHEQEGKKFMKCTECKILGTFKVKNCQSCSQKTYLFKDEDKLLCKKCLSGFCPKNVTGVIPLPCLFCDDELTTWYIYESLG